MIVILVADDSAPQMRRLPDEVWSTDAEFVAAIIRDRLMVCWPGKDAVHLNSVTLTVPCGAIVNLASEKN